MQVRMTWHCYSATRDRHFMLAWHSRLRKQMAHEMLPGRCRADHSPMGYDSLVVLAGRGCTLEPIMP